MFVIELPHDGYGNVSLPLWIFEVEEDGEHLYRTLAPEEMKERYSLLGYQDTFIQTEGPVRPLSHDEWISCLLENPLLPEEYGKVVLGLKIQKIYGPTWEQAQGKKEKKDMEHLQFYQDMATGTVMALVMNEDGTPAQQSTPDIHQGKPYYHFYGVARKVSLTIVKLSGPKLPDPKEYRRISKKEAQAIDQMTEYSIYAIFAVAGGVSDPGRFFEEIGKEGKDWQEIPHKNLRPSLTFHADIQYIYCDQDFFHPRCAVIAFGLETINRVIKMQRKYSLHTIVESSKLYDHAPTSGGCLIEVRWKSDSGLEDERCTTCGKIIHYKEEK